MAKTKTKNRFIQNFSNPIVMIISNLLILAAGLLGFQVRIIADPSWKALNLNHFQLFLGVVLSVQPVI